MAKEPGTPKSNLPDSAPIVEKIEAVLPKGEVKTAELEYEFVESAYAPAHTDSSLERVFAGDADKFAHFRTKLAQKLGVSERQIVILEADVIPESYRHIAAERARSIAAARVNWVKFSVTFYQRTEQKKEEKEEQA